MATMVLSRAYRNTDEKMDPTQMIHATPFKFLTGAAASISAIVEACVPGGASGRDAWSEFFVSVSPSRFFSEAGASNTF